MDALELRIIQLEKTVAKLVELNKDRLSNDDKPTKPIKSKKSKKVADTKSDDDAPKKKRAPSGYLLYINSIRDQVKTELGDELGPKDVTKELAKRWKALDEEQRTEWNDKSKAMKDSDTE